jgi:Fe-S-cluster containining protein
MTACIRCGTCCRKGGPVLHHEDKKILLHHQTVYAHLITIRRGELTYNPVSNLVEQAHREMIKVSGRGDDWTCCFFREEDTSCMIYAHRFLECRLLKCWQPEDIVGIVGQDILCRSDIINPGDPVLEIIGMHERECSLQEVKTLTDQVTTGKEHAEALRKLSGLVQHDASIRSHAFSDLGLKKEYELFIFGRPLPDILRDFGLSFRKAQHNGPAR